MSISLSVRFFRDSSSHLPPNFTLVGKRCMNGTTHCAFMAPVHFSVIHVRLSFVTRVPPARVSTKFQLRRSAQSAPEFWTMFHSHDDAFGRVAVKPLGTRPSSLLEKPRSM